METIENRENFYSYYINDLAEIYYILKDRYRLSGFMDNTRIEHFIEIILDNLIFKEVPIDNEDSDNDISDYEYFE
tara:strand:- start:275 stop:499 length:225 start_codon:yes stop_codon:yes gene_type:complete